MNLTKSDEKHKLSRMSQFIWLEELNTDTVNPYWQILENLSRNFFPKFQHSRTDSCKTHDELLIQYLKK